jgi:hypothetical protein
VDQEQRKQEQSKERRTGDAPHGEEISDENLDEVSGGSHGNIPVDPPVTGPKGGKP